MEDNIKESIRKSKKSKDPETLSKRLGKVIYEMKTSDNQTTKRIGTASAKIIHAITSPTYHNTLKNEQKDEHKDLMEFMTHPTTLKTMIKMQLDPKKFILATQKNFLYNQQKIPIFERNFIVFRNETRTFPETLIPNPMFYETFVRRMMRDQTKDKEQIVSRKIEYIDTSRRKSETLGEKLDTESESDDTDSELDTFWDDSESESESSAMSSPLAENYVAEL